MRISPNNIQTLKENEIFVFGSNEAAIHGAGAALLAYKKFGASKQIYFGLSGQSFAIPTKNTYLQTLPLDKIKKHIDSFVQETKWHKSLNFLVTEIGCGLAGYKPEQIAPLFKDALKLENVYLPESFVKLLKQEK